VRSILLLVNDFHADERRNLACKRHDHAATYLRYIELAGSNGSTVYPVRFSRTKCRDQKPLLSEEALQFLRESKKGRNIVLFDEDIAGGKTADAAKAFFRKILCDARSTEEPEFFANFRAYRLRQDEKRHS
jgi:hypothetical protein